MANLFFAMVWPLVNIYLYKFGQLYSLHQQASSQAKAIINAKLH